MRSMMMVEKGDRVMGEYLGYSFTGHVYHYRYYTLRGDAVVIFVKLDEPMDILDCVRDLITVTVTADGKSIDRFGSHIRICYQ